MSLLNVLISIILMFMIKLAIDILLLIFVKKSFLKKFELIHTMSQAKILENRYTERKLVLNIVFNDFVVLLLHLPDIFISAYFVFKGNKYIMIIKAIDYFTLILNDVADVCFITGFSLSFFIFYFFNKQFRRSFKNLLCKQK